MHDDLRAELGRAMALARLLTASEEEARAVVQRAFTNDPVDAVGTVPPRVQSVVRSCLALWEREPVGEMPLPEFLQDGHHVRHPVVWEAPTRDSELASFIRRCVFRLPVRERIVFLLGDIQGMEREDVACCLGWHRDDVTAALHRARQALRGQIDRRLGTGVT
jgi:DNA-directed RNA polymerase specialized sigma24 family protein